MLSSNAVEETTFSFSREAPQPPERRGARRHMTILRVGSLIIDGRRELCLVRNISAGGLMAHVYSLFHEGQVLEVELKTNQRIPGRVSWTSEANIGVAFDTPIDVEDLLAAQSTDDGWRPRLPRVEVDRLATLRVGARVLGVSTRDISQGGVKVETDHPLEPDAPVVLTLDRFRPIHGTVRWYAEGLCGISFNELVPFRELMRWLRTE
ncbi:PilZ domain-containing protein [Allosphingosinicella indica]|uniref:PilZ domain-containing protein n=1 Tax=Allosphingosinicella indica TaxID=941907 RepID=A0A1X7GRI5_9SPHN|nr:PilZ domain-containing protein [Allosphingosinicella indica]SMF72919.1 PilZ domain-containing protein [Allosphingosinicella indica]